MCTPHVPRIVHLMKTNKLNSMEQNKIAEIRENNKAVVVNDLIDS